MKIGSVSVANNGVHNNEKHQPPEEPPAANQAESAPQQPSPISQSTLMPAFSSPTVTANQSKSSAPLDEKTDSFSPSIGSPELPASAASMRGVSSNEGVMKPSTSSGGVQEQITENHNKHPMSDPEGPMHSAQASTPVEHSKEQLAVETNSHPPATKEGVSETTPPSAGPPTSQTPPGTNTPSTATSYFPSTAALTSFFSSGSKPRSIPQATTPPPSITSGTSVPASEQKLSLNSETGLSAPAIQPSLEGSPTPLGADLGGHPLATSALKTKPASPPPSQPPPSSLSALMSAAVPYLGARKASKPSLLPQGGSALAVPPDQGGAGASTDGVRSASDVSQAEMTSSADRSSSKTTLGSDLPRFTNSTSPEVRPPEPSSQATSLKDLPQDVPVTPLQAPQPSTSSHGSQQEASPQANLPGTSTHAIPQEFSPQDVPPGTFAQAPPQETSPQEFPPTTFSQSPPGATSSQAIPPGTSSQAPAPSTSSQANSPGSSYLSMPSFLPSWSTLTAQLPSLASTPFTNREQVPTSLSSSLPKQDVAKQGAPVTEATLARQLESFPPLSGPVPPPSLPPKSFPASNIAVLSKPSTVSALSNLQPHGNDDSPPLSVSYPAPLASSGDPSNRTTAGVSQTGGKEQAPPRFELEPPSAAAADAIAGGIASVFGPVTREADKQVEAALRSQEKLALSIDRLTKGLDKLLEETPQPLVAQQAARLAHIRKRVQSLASTLKVIQGRIDSMNWALDRKSARAPFIRGRSATAPNSPQSYQPVSQPFERVRQIAPQRGTPAKSEKDILETSSANSVHSSVEAELKERGRAAETIGDARQVLGKASSRSPDKGHRRAMSHDVRSSTAMLNRR